VSTQSDAREIRGDPPRTHSVTTEQASNPVAAVGSLTQMIREECEVVDRTRAIPATVVDALRDARVFHMLAPRAVGGAETDPLTFLRVVEEVSYADGSAGWCTMIGGSYGIFGGMLPPEGAREIFGDPATISAGNFRPDKGVAEGVNGGYRVSGRWELASGSSHAGWYIAGAMLMHEGAPLIGADGRPLMREFFFPASEARVIDTWDSTGLRGTASHDYEVQDVFVPEHRTLWFQEPPSERGALYRMPPVAMFSTFIAAVQLGIARHAIDAFIELATTKIPTMSQIILADRVTAQASLGRATAMVSSARRYLENALQSLWERVEAGHAPTLGARGDLWLASAHAGHTAHAAIDMLYTAAGATAVYATSPFDRCLRDARTALQHVCTQDVHFELAGRLALERDALGSVWGLDYRGEA
jgi:alkylation response protein AidB-like acyl-CoA dehydrogenase